MIGIYSLDHLARAMWADDEEAFRAGEVSQGRAYRPVGWDQAHDLDRAEFRMRAERVVRLCVAQAKDLCKPPV